MIRTLLENNFVPQGSVSQSSDYLDKQYQKEQLKNADKYRTVIDDKITFENAYNETDWERDDNDISQEEAINQRHLFNEKMETSRRAIQKINNESALLDKYGDDFAYLHRMKEIEDCSNEGVKLDLVEIPKDYARGTNTDDSYYADLAGGAENEKNIALKIKLDEETPEFYISLQQHDNPVNGKRERQMKIAFDDEILPNLSKDNLQRILAFCESHGFSILSADFPFSLDGLEDEDRFKSIFNELQHEAKMREELARRKQEEFDLALEKEINYSIAEQNENTDGAEQSEQHESSGNPSSVDKLYERFIGNDESAGASASTSSGISFAAIKDKSKNLWQKVKGKAKKAIFDSDIENKLEKNVLEDSLGKERGMSYFKGKASSGLFGGTNWTVYTVFDTADKKNMIENGRRDKDGKPKFTYSYRLFVRQDSDGNLHFAYHMRDNKKVSEDMVNALVGQFKDLGMTHIRFPNGVPDSDKKIWRIALAEKGIVPVGMSIDRAKAQGMLEAAKKKLSDEEYAKYKLRLGMQMDENYRKKGKTLDTSEREYIDSLINSHYYEPFVNAYNALIKSGLSQQLRKAGDDTKMGAAKKVGAYKAFSRLFAVYDSEANKGTIAQSPELSEEEARRIRAAGLDIEPHKLTKEQMAEIYGFLLHRCIKEADKELEDALMEAKDVGNVAAKGAKRPDNTIIKEVFDAARNGFEDVNECLKNKGCDEINMPKVMGRMQYNIFYERHPDFLRRNVPTPTPTHTHSGPGGGRPTP